ncbi:MAG: imidazole glycerol phosphate synthase subunit HisF [Endomicrobiales bacterium]|nr:imidazole glycerol phosphate synthase subunit HisF [Endomicrobiales bacterium]
MSKVRIIPTLLYKESTLVKGVSFDSWRRVGSLMQAIKVYNMREVDELVFLDIKATEEGRKPDFRLVDDFADECFMPLSVGGGIRDIEDVRLLLEVGADKVVVNTAAVENPGIVKQIANKFGSQCVVVSIDYKYKTGGEAKVVVQSGKKGTDIDPVEHARSAEKLGAGEIMLTSVDLDGTMKGYDIQMTRKVSDAVSIPVIASGGAGNYEHMEKAVKDGGASAIAAASIFHFTEQTPLEAKQYLRKKGISVRV